MTEEKHESEWEISSSGRMEKVTTYPSGMVRKESINPRIEETRITELYPTACRVSYFWQEISDPNLKIVQQMSKTYFFRGVEFFDREKQIGEIVDFKKKNSLQIFFIEGTKLDTFWVEPRALVSLEYDTDGRLKQCFLQAESPLAPKKKEEVRDWRESLPILINYLETTEPDNLEGFKEAHEDIYSEYVVENFPDENDPLISEANVSVTQLITELINSLPPDDYDRKKVIKLLEAFGWRSFLAHRLLEILDKYGSSTDSINQALGKFGKDLFLNSEVADRINLLQSLPFKLSQMILEVKDFQVGEFRHREAEIELDTENPPDYIEKAYNQEGGAAYGEEIPVQENTFKIERKNDSITVTCLSNRRKQRWIATFPLTIPFQKIVEIYSDQEADFRTIKPLLQTSFRR